MSKYCRNSAMEKYRRDLSKLSKISWQKSCSSKLPGGGREKFNDHAFIGNIKLV